MNGSNLSLDKPETANIKKLINMTNDKMLRSKTNFTFFKSTPQASGDIHQSFLL